MEHYRYEEPTTLKEVDISDRYPGNYGKSLLRLRDFTAEGRNLVNPHPTFLKYYSKLPYWVQVVDEDDWIGQAEFNNLSEAEELFELILNSNPHDIYKLLIF